MAMPTRRTPRLQMDADDALIAFIIAAMESSGHVSADEAARAHNVIWSTRRFRRRDGDDVGRRIARMKALTAEHGATTIIKAGAGRISRRLRPAAFAILADIVLVDGKLDPREARFLRQVGADLQLEPDVIESVVGVLQIKNSL